MNDDLREMLEANRARADEVRAELSERKQQVAEIDDRDPVRTNASAEDNEIGFLLSYRGDNPGLLWRGENARRELAARQAAIAKEQERTLLSRHQAARTDANTKVKEMIEGECMKVME